MCKLAISRSAPVREFTPQEVREHNKTTDCWITVNGRVYDVTPWLASHPGGPDIVLLYAGDDATDVFTAFHHTREFGRLARFEVGTIRAGSEEPVAECLQAFRELNTELWREGWFKPDDGFMSKIVTITFALLAACVALLCAARFGDGPAAAAAAAAAGQRGWGECERGALVMAAGLCLSQFWQQSLLIAHDACHTGITRKRRWDALIGAFFGGACAGLGTSWWTKDHNEHHAATNQVLGSKPGSVGGDRSCGLPPFLTVSEKQLARDDGKKGQPLWYWVLLRAQYWLYWPVMLVASRFVWHLAGVALAPKDRYLARDVGFLFGFVAYMWGLFQLVPEGYGWLFYWTAHLGIGGLHVTTNLNHYHMPMTHDVCTPANGGWLKHQLLTTSNIAGSTFLDWWAGGLQLQVEHHLFPQMPRHRLNKVKPAVMALCHKFGLDYQEKTFWDLNMLVWNGLWDVTCSDSAALGLFQLAKLN